MKLSEKIKSLRKGAGLSQEEFGARLNVSRQAITKWESGEGLPDIGNLLVLSRMFKISVDDLLSEEKALAEKLFLYESRVTYDIEDLRDYDIHLGCAAEITVSGNEGEKLEVVCSSNDIADVSGLIKIKVDDEGRSADVDLKLRDGITETLCREALHIDIFLPQRYVHKVEIAARTGKFSLRHLEYDNFEFGGKAEEIHLSEIKGETELDVNSDVVIKADSFAGKLSLNQVAAVSTMHIPSGKTVATRTHGIRTRILCDRSELINPDAEDIIELNGIKSELTLVFD
ncbi:MAG: helix-turn-helix transcriptional regulator [Bacteroidales bacterium]|nr:helix-turn-helix transcriptional regulator [Bacteroidales bacterium]